ncbi:leucine-rich repeat protein [Acetobacterium wieringae]|uniref:Leucine-rich repeat protein n=1 Tax=Acetobacterium wieringae TaxID=52694 RepID=A0ABY6HCZ0_9FIRM|nr:leucine-rich repeat protein [Acetobacterium wieringae]UYO62375.1 leucine-rich repeat protein [Acetobacterium wieringae]VUZ22971.1 Uncharacterised protein [Acetobacterium wieringae]
MKRMLQNGMSVFIVSILFFTVVPLGVMAETLVSEDENFTLETNNAIQNEPLTTQIDDTIPDENDQLNASDVSIEVNLTATNNLKTDIGKAMIKAGISDYDDITSLKINAGSGINFGKSDSDFIRTLVNIKKLDLSNFTETTFPANTFSASFVSGCKKLETVILHDGTKVSASMFQDCISLKTIDLSKSNPDLGNSAFYGCASLENVALPYGAKLNHHIFLNCCSLTSMDLTNANPLIGSNAFNGCSNLEKVILPENTILTERTFYNCSRLDDINWSSIKSLSDVSSTSIGTNFGYCAFDFTQNYPFPSWNDNNVSAYNGDQIPKLYFSLAQESYELNTGDAFTIPTPIFKTKSGTDYNNLETYKDIYSPWLDKNVSYKHNMTYDTTITHEGQVVDTIDTSIPGKYQITYDLLSTTYADKHTLTCTVTVNAGYSISSFTADKSSGQIIDSTINLTAAATSGEAPYQYKFYYRLNNATTVLKDFSSANTASFKPTTAGNYTLFVDAKDKNGKTCTKSISDYVIKSDVSESINCSYRTHVQNVGWQDWKSNGTMSGTSGQGLRLEGIEIKLDNQGNDLGVEYSTHIQNIGWQDFKSNGTMSGTSGQALRLEAIKINLTGNDAALFDIYYHVHAQNIGWMGWAKNGETAGTAGYGYRLEGIEIKVVPKGDPAPNNNVVCVEPFKENNDEKIMGAIAGQWTDGKNYIYFQNVNKSSLNGAIQLKDIRDGMTGKYRIVGVNGNVLNVTVYDQVNGGIALINTNFSIDTGIQGDGIINLWGKTWTYVSDSPIFK